MHFCLSIGNDQNIQSDEELQNWGKLLSTPVEHGGAGVNVSNLDKIGN